MKIQSLKIDQQGGPKVHPKLIIMAECKDIVVCSVDVVTKNCGISATGSGDGVPCILLEATQKSSPIHPKHKRGELTHISFPQYKGWSVWSSDLNKYTLRMCLLKVTNS